MKQCTCIQCPVIVRCVCVCVCVCVWMTACSCTPGDAVVSSSNVTTSLSGDCDTLTGRCHCQTNVIGDTCDRCAENTFNFSVSAGCQPCHCHIHGSRSQACNVVSNCLFACPFVPPKWWTKMYIN